MGNENVRFEPLEYTEKDKYEAQNFPRFTVQFDPSLVPTGGVENVLVGQIGTNIIWRKSDYGVSTNWVKVKESDACPNCALLTAMGTDDKGLFVAFDKRGGS